MAVAAAAGRFACAPLLLAISALRKPGREMTLAIEVHNAMLESLVAETRSVGGDLTSIGAKLRHPFDSTLLGLVGPLVSILIRALKKTPTETKTT